MILTFSNLFPLSILLIVGTIVLNAQPRTQQPDIHSFANSDEIRIDHLALDLTVDFVSKKLSGKAVLSITQIKKTSTLVLDSRGLVVSKVNLDGNTTPAEFSVGKAHPIFGAPISIQITPDTRTVSLYYSTSPDAAALQWLSPSQTAGKDKPFLFTQSQAILARSWVPCMDGPGVRMTYSAVIRTRPDLMAVMSAGNPVTRSKDGVYSFEMKQPIPSYLLALAVGDLQFQPLGERSGVYAEPQVIEKAAYEFADLEKMITAAEELYGPYQWERYDLLVLPPSFPFGGMENPRLTFATPTILAGDRSLVALVAHELAHSWSGNLVTNATWNDFWINEGFTVYFEKRIMEKVYGREYSEMLSVLTLKDLQSSIQSMGAANPDTRLKLDLTGRDPDEGVTDIAYNKGYFFLRLCEEAFGRDQWDAFLKKYFNDNAFTSMTTEGFLDRLTTHFQLKKRADLSDKLRIDEWVYSPGLLSNCPIPVSAEFDRVTAHVSAFLNGTQASQLSVQGWTTQHWLFFLRSLPDTIRLEQVIELDYAFKLTQSGNSEIESEWFKRCIRADYSSAYDEMKKFLITIGRRKLVKPLYEELAKTVSGKALAKQIYVDARPGYHSVTANTVDDILK